MIDTHCHLTFVDLHDRSEQVIADARAHGVDGMISVGTTPDAAWRGVALAEAHPGVFATAGVHPGYAQQIDDLPRMRAQLRDLLDHPKVVALGEMGLDRHHPDPPLEVQRPVFEAQLELMHERPDIEGVIHNRQATDETLAILADSGLPGERFVFHCFSGTEQELEAILAIGAMVSFTGIVTFNSAAAVARASDRVPLKRLMIETDSPYLTPAPHRKVRPNEPQYIRFVAAFLAQRRGMAMKDFTAAVDENARRFFGLPENVFEKS